MLLTTHTGIVVNSDHISCIALRHELPTPSEPDLEPGTLPTFRVLLCMVNSTLLVAARSLSEEAASFVRKDIAHSWETGATSWKAVQSLKRFAEGAYFAEDETVSSPSDAVEESEVPDGAVSPVHDL